VGLNPFDNFAVIMKELQQDFELIGYQKDRQNLVPHLTLGRIKSIADRVFFQRTIDQYREVSSLSHRAEFVILFESILKENGPEYRILQKFFFMTLTSP